MSVGVAVCMCVCVCMCGWGCGCGCECVERGENPLLTMSLLIFKPDNKLLRTN